MSTRLFRPLTCVLLLALASASAQEPGSAGDTVDLDGGLAPIPIIKSNPIFEVSNGEEEWKKAFRHATTPMDELGVEPQRFTETMQEGFRSVTNFRSEWYNRTKTACEITLVVGAKEAWANPAKPSEVNLAGLRIVFFVTPSAMSLSPSPVTANPARNPSALPPALRRSRFVITAEEGTVDLMTGEGKAAPGFWHRLQSWLPMFPNRENCSNPQKGVRIEIFTESADGSLTEPTGELSCEGLHWRAWNDPRTGTSELTLRAISANTDVEPEVEGRFISRNPETKEQSEMEIKARGMVFQTSVMDHMQPVKDTDGRVLGLTNVVRRRVLFHRKIGVRIDGSESAPIIPFQQTPEPGREKAPNAKRPVKPPSPPSRTLVGCFGPAILDLAVPPRTLPPGPADRLVPMAMRFEFLNGVELHKSPRDKPAAGQPAGTSAILTCRHLCFQSAADAPASLPEYAEATGGIRIYGTRPTTDGAAPTPFHIDCQRIYFDGANDATVLQGQPMYPARIVDEMGSLTTQSCVISRKTQMLYMPPSTIPKEALVRGTRTAPTTEGTAAAPAIDFSGGDLEATWTGSFRREMVPTLGPGNTEILKEILILEKDVKIRQAQKGLKIEGQNIRIVRDATTGQVERLEGRGGVLVRSSEMQVKGEFVTVELRYDQKNQIAQNTVIVWSPPASGRRAVLWQGESAVGGERFIIDALNNNFQAYGGVVARFNLPESSGQKGAEASGGAALMPGFSAGGPAAKGGGNRLALQCDGDFEFNGATGQLRVTRNVLIAQDPMTIVSDKLILTLAPPAKEEPKDPKDKKTPAKDSKKDGKADEKPETGLFSANVKSLECRGRVEINTPTQVVHCDRLFYDMASYQVFLETDRPEDKVRVYLQDGEGTKILEVTRRLDYDSKSGVFSPAERMFLKPFPGTVPLPRTPSAPPGGPAR
jgi:lipopolysaccharide export system protein LptA